MHHLLESDSRSRASTEGSRFPIDVHLRDGTPAMIWPLLATDGPGLQRGFDDLSPRSRQLRFLSPRAGLTPAMLRLLVDGVDQRRHLAFVLVALPPGEPDVVVGIGRLVQTPEDPSAADLAVTVKDDWQRRGIGALLAEALVARRPAEVTHLLTYVATDNPASLAMLQRLGPTTVAVSSGVYEVSVALRPVPLPAGHGRGV